MTEGANYDLWKAEPLPLPPRSRFYHLEPIGWGTPYTESLTGYINRLAAAHCITVRAFLTEVGRLLGKHYLLTHHCRLPGDTYRQARSLNGTSDLSTTMVQLLGDLTLQSGLRFLTMMTWQDVVASTNLLRPFHAWCPSCYKSWRQSGHIIYEPLIWTFDVVKICLHHEERLTSCCPHCNKKLNLLAPLSQPGYCSKCLRWLGHTVKGAQPQKDLSDNELEWQKWIIDNIGEMLASAPFLPSSPAINRIAKVITLCIEQLAEGRSARFAAFVKKKKNVIWYWSQGDAKIELPSLLQVCHHLGISILDFFFKEPFVINREQLSAVSDQSASCWIKESRRSPKFDEQLAKDALLAALEETPPPCMRTVARKLGGNVRVLYKHFQELCYRVSARYTEYMNFCVQEDSARLREEVRQAVFNLHQSGIYPTKLRVSALLTLPSRIRRPDAITAFHQAKKELGLK